MDHQRSTFHDVRYVEHSQRNERFVLSEAGRLAEVWRSDPVGWAPRQDLDHAGAEAHQYADLLGVVVGAA